MIYCAPFAQQIDKNVRMIGITGRLIFKGVDFYKKKSRAICKWSYPRSDDQAGTIMPKPRGDKDFLESNFDDKSDLTEPKHRVKVKSILVSQPPKELIYAYEAKKKQFVGDNIHRMLLRSQSKKPVFDELEKLKITARQMRVAGKSWSAIAEVVGRSSRAVRFWMDGGGESTLHTGISGENLT